MNLNIKKTGTTIAGIVYKEGLILAADTRATNSGITCDKNCCKIHFLSSNICCCGAGTSADIQFLTKSVSNQLIYQKLLFGRQTDLGTTSSYFKRVLFEAKGVLSCAIILGGKDLDGTHLYTIHSQGATYNHPFCSMGSGSVAAIAVLERFFKTNMQLLDAIIVIKEAILAGVYNDLGSGGNLDIAIIDNSWVKYKRSVDLAKREKNNIILE